MSERVAVVAVHGVAYHEPGASANAVSELLLGLPEDDRGKYGPFSAETIHIPLHPLNILRPIQGPRGGFLSERTVYLTNSWQSSHGAKKLAGEKSHEIAANEFMRLLLQEYRGSKGRDSEGKDNGPKDERDDTAYRTTRLTGIRTRKNGAADEQPTSVHVYEMYWADLTRPKKTLVSFFMAFYQLLFHLASLSRLAISTSYENRNDRLWRALDWTQGWAVRMLTLPIPILNLLLLISLLGALPRSIANDLNARTAAIFGAGFLGLLVYAWLSRKLPATRWPLTWVLFPLIFVIPLAKIAAIFSGPNGFARAILAIEALLLGSIVLYLSAGSYDDVRDGASEAALILWLLWIIPFAILLFWRTRYPVDQITLWMMQVLLAALRLSWILLFCFAFAAFALGGVAWRKFRRHEKKKKERGDPYRHARARAAIRTSRLALAIPTMGVLIVTLALFSVLFVKTTAKKPGSTPIAERLFGCDIKPLLPSPSSLSLLILNEKQAGKYIDGQLNPNSMSPNEYFKGALVWSASLTFPISLMLLLSSFAVMILWLVPSISGEMTPPRRSDNRSSKRSGSWLSRGLDASKITTIVLWVAAFVPPAILWWWTERHKFPGLLRIFDQIPEQLKVTMHTWLAHRLEISAFLVHWTAFILVGIGGVAGSLAILASLAKSGSSILGIILDVDNYLRTSPKDQTPRARIMERYVSLLRYLSEYKDPDGKGYDRIVIVAHSLGALISADLLRFLKTQRDPDSRIFHFDGENPERDRPKIQLRLFTMGNPLRQLLNRFFPYLYEWVHPLPDNSLHPLSELPQSTPPKIGINDSPDPNLLGVERWVSAYRSGDYVGRSVWLNEWYDREFPARTDPLNPEPAYLVLENPPGRREEMCIGAGAHQHYWDQSAPDIAKKLNELI